MPADLQRHEARAAAMGACGDLDVEALFQGFQPAQRHADAAIRLAGRDGFQKRFGRSTEIHQFDVEAVLGEYPLLLGDEDRREADRGWRSSRI